MRKILLFFLIITPLIAQDYRAPRWIYSGLNLTPVVPNLTILPNGVSNLGTSGNPFNLVYGDTMFTNTIYVNDIDSGYVPYSISGSGRLTKSTIFYKGTDVGINTTSPARDFHIYRNNSDVDAMLLLENNGDGDAVLGFRKDGFYGYSFGVDRSALAFKISASSTDLETNTKFWINSTGFGNVSPLASFHINGTAMFGTGSGASLTNSAWLFTNTGGMPELKGYGTDGDLFLKITGNTSDQALFSDATIYDFDAPIDVSVLSGVTRIASLTNNGFVKTSGNNGTLSIDSTLYVAVADSNSDAPGGYATKKYVDDAVIGAGGYTDEAAQDAVGGILDNATTGDINFTYDDVTPKISAILKKINGFAVTDAAPSSGQGFFWNTDSSKFVFSTPSGSMVYPGVGIAVSTGSAWGASLTDNSSDWNTAYSLSHSHTNKATLDLVESAFLDADSTKLAGIEDGAEANNISDGDATDLTDGNNTTLHKHDGMYYREGEIDTMKTVAQWNANKLQDYEISNVNPTDGQVLQYSTDSSKYIPTTPASSGGDTYIIKAADEYVNSSTTLQDDNDFYFSVGSGEAYIVEFVLFTSSASADPDIKINLYMEDVTIMTSALSGLSTDLTITSIGHYGNLVQQLNSATFGIASGGGTFITGYCYFQNDADTDTFKIQWAQAASNVAASIISQGSYMRYRKVN